MQCYMAWCGCKGLVFGRTELNSCSWLQIYCNKLYFVVLLFCFLNSVRVLFRIWHFLLLKRGPWGLLIRMLIDSWGSDSRSKKLLCGKIIWKKYCIYIGEWITSMTYLSWKNCYSIKRVGEFMKHWFYLFRCCPRKLATREWKLVISLQKL